MIDTNEKQPCPTSRTYGLIQDGEQAHAHLFVTCQLYSLVRPQCVVSCVVSWPLYLEMYRCTAIFKLAFGLRVGIVQCSSLLDFPFYWGMALGATISGIIWVDTRCL